MGTVLYISWVINLQFYLYAVGLDNIARWTHWFFKLEIMHLLNKYILSVHKQLVYWFQDDFSNWASISCKSYLGKSYAISPSVNKSLPSQDRAEGWAIWLSGTTKIVRRIIQFFPSLSAFRDDFLFKCKLSDVSGFREMQLNEKSPR